MPLVHNPFWSGNVVWKCAKCGEVFAFIDTGEKHEKKCRCKPKSDEQRAREADKKIKESIKHFGKKHK
jgi:hypothetical protein